MAKRRGRPPKHGDRYDSGKLKPSVREAMSGALWQRMLANAERVLRDPKFGTELGRLGAAGDLTPSEVAIGFRIAEVYGRFEFYQNIRRAAASPHYIREMVSEAAGGDSEMEDGPGQNDRGRGFVDTDRDERERQATETFRAFQTHLPHEFRSNVEALCVDDRHIGLQGLQQVRAAFALVKEFFSGKRRGLSKAERKKLNRPSPLPTPRQTPAIVALPPVRINALKAAFLAHQRKLLPNLSDDDLETSWNVFCALRDRIAFRLEKVGAK